MSALNRIASVVLVGALGAAPAVVMAGGARNGNAGANAPATAVQQRDRVHARAQTGTQAQEQQQLQKQQKLQKRVRVRTEEPAQDPAATGARNRHRNGG
jgi:hypothetical protein